MLEMKMPPCVAYHDTNDPTCNGDQKSQDPDERKACPWRDRCAGFGMLMEKDSIDPLNFFDVVDGPGAAWAQAHKPEAFIAMCDAAVRRFNIVGGVAGGKKAPIPELLPPIPLPLASRKLAGEKPAPEKPAASPPAASQEANEVEPRRKYARGLRRAKRPGVREKHRRVLELFEFFKQDIVTRFKRVEFAQPGQVAAVGQLYVRDRAASSGYFRIYMKTNVAKDRPLVAARLKPRNVTLDIELPCTPEQFAGSVAKRTLERMDVQPLKSGYFSTLVVGLDREGAALVADALKKMASNGIVGLGLPQT